MTSVAAPRRVILSRAGEGQLSRGSVKAWLSFHGSMAAALCRVTIHGREVQCGTALAGLVLGITGSSTSFRSSAVLKMSRQSTPALHQACPSRLVGSHYMMEPQTPIEQSTCRLGLGHECPGVEGIPNAGRTRLRCSRRSCRKATIVFLMFAAQPLRPGW